MPDMDYSFTDMAALMKRDTAMRTLPCDMKDRTGWKCPICQTYVGNIEFCSLSNFCPNCGQRLKQDVVK